MAAKVQRGCSPTRAGPRRRAARAGARRDARHRTSPRRASSATSIRSRRAAPPSAAQRRRGARRRRRRRRVPGRAPRAARRPAHLVLALPRHDAGPRAAPRRRTPLQAQPAARRPGSATSVDEQAALAAFVGLPMSAQDKKALAANETLRGKIDLQELLGTLELNRIRYALGLSLVRIDTNRCRTAPPSLEGHARARLLLPHVAVSRASSASASALSSVPAPRPRTSRPAAAPAGASSKAST